MFWSWVPELSSNSAFTGGVRGMSIDDQRYHVGQCPFLARGYAESSVNCLAARTEGGRREPAAPCNQPGVPPGECPTSPKKKEEPGVEKMTVEDSLDNIADILEGVNCRLAELVDAAKVFTKEWVRVHPYPHT